MAFLKMLSSAGYLAHMISRRKVHSSEVGRAEAILFAGSNGSRSPRKTDFARAGRACAAEETEEFSASSRFL